MFNTSESVLFSHLNSPKGFLKSFGQVFSTEGIMYSINGTMNLKCMWWDNTVFVYVFGVVRSERIEDKRLGGSGCYQTQAWPPSRVWHGILVECPNLPPKQPLIMTDSCCRLQSSYRFRGCWQHPFKLRELSSKSRRWETFVTSP